VICSTNRVPGPGSKIHYPVPNPGRPNTYTFLRAKAHTVFSAS